MRNRRLAIVAVPALAVAGTFVAIGAGVPTSAAYADPGSTTVQDYVRTDVETVACTGATPWYVTEDNHEVVHVANLSDGSLHLVDNVAQTFTVQHADGTGPVYSGRATIHIDGIIPAAGRQSAPFSYVFRAYGTAPDGSVLAMDEVAHAQANPDGSVNVTFDHLTCG